MKKISEKIKDVVETTLQEDVINIIKTDHRKVDLLFFKYKAATTPEERRQLIEELVTELTAHATAEEKLVYPLLENEAEDDALEAYEEHHVMKRTLAELRDYNGTEKDIDAKVTVLSELVKHHVKEEEKDFLPKLKKTGVDLKELGESFAARKEQLMNQENKVGNKRKAGSKKTSKTSMRKAS